jgi:hypothetical protein
MILGANGDVLRKFILGNMAGHPQTFCVLGFFWPPKRHGRQVQLFT